MSSLSNIHMFRFTNPKVKDNSHNIGQEWGQKPIIPPQREPETGWPGD